MTQSRDIHEGDEALRVLQAFNPWWTDKPFRNPDFRRLAFHASRSLLVETNLRRAILLSGPRRVGKTTVLMQIAEDLVQRGVERRSILYLSLDHPLLKLITLTRALRVYHETTYSEDKPAYLLLDEVQYSKDWETEIKLLVDHHPEYRIIATGSATVIHREKLAESGVGRWVTVPVPTLSFYEFAQMRNEAPAQIKKFSKLKPTDLFKKTTAELHNLNDRFRSLLPVFQNYLLQGGFPETAMQRDVSLCQRLLREDVVERVLKRDMAALFGVRNVEELERLFIYLCIHCGEIVATQNVAQHLGTSATTVANHLQHLENANLIYKLPPTGLGGKKVLKAKNKYYVVDAALRNAVLLKGDEVLTNSQEMGMIVETTVLRHLIAYYYKDVPRISYFRDAKTQKEVDIIVKGPTYCRPFEVKYQNNAELTPDDGIVGYCAEDESASHAFFVTKTDFSTTQFDGSKTVYMKVPAHILCYLLGQAERLYWGEPD